MGPSSKRRGGNADAVGTMGGTSGGFGGERSGGTSSSRLSKNSGGRSKDKHGSSHRSDRVSENDRGERSRNERDRDDHGGGNAHSIRHNVGRGGARRLFLARATAAGRNGGTANAGGPPSDVPPSSHSRRRKALDPTLLARGMSARLIGARVTSHIKIVSPEDVERDLRHMEAYGAACTAYAQQFFAYTNRELVAQGIYGPAPPTPGQSGLTDHYGSDGITPDDARLQQGSYDSVTGQYNQTQKHQQQVLGSNSSYRDNATPHNATSLSPAGGVSMPVRIDPEEEKRLAILRKRVAASEAKREVLETEYLSLRAHYVHESHRLERTRLAMSGQLQLLQELVKRRGEVLALRRVRCAVARDILHCLKHRGRSLAGDEKDDGNRHSVAASDDRMEGVEYSNGKNSEDHEKDSQSPPEDMADFWMWLESQLKIAEEACLEIETPRDLLLLKSSSPSDSSWSSRGKSDDGGEADMSSRKKAKTESGEKNKKMSDDTNADTSEKDNSINDSAKAKELTESASVSTNKKGSKHLDEPNDNIVPWNCQILPRTPFDIPILLSYLSYAPDRSAAFGCGGVLGSSSSSLSWIETNLPKFYQPAMDEEQDDLMRLQEEAEFLTQELEREKEQNQDLQRQLISSRKRSDEMCAMMSLLRTETEAVLNRHNVILETPEARSRASALHAKAVEEAAAAAAAAAEEDEEDEHPVPEVDDSGVPLKDKPEEDGATITAEDEVSHDDEGEVHEDDDVDDEEDQVSFSIADRGASGAATPVGESDSAEEGEIQEEDEENDGDDEEDDIEYDDDEEEGEIVEENGQPLMEVIVPHLDNDGVRNRSQLSSKLDNEMAKSKSLDTDAKATTGNPGEEEDEEDEEEGEIREDGDDWNAEDDNDDHHQDAGDGRNISTVKDTSNGKFNRGMGNIDGDDRVGAPDLMSGGPVVARDSILVSSRPSPPDLESGEALEVPADDGKKRSFREDSDEEGEVSSSSSELVATKRRKI